MSEFDVVGASLKVSGEAPLPTQASEYEHDDEVYVLGKARVNEVSFPEDKEGDITRVHKAKLTQAFVVDSEHAEELIASQREQITGQGSLLAEVRRAVAGKAEHDDVF